MKRPALFPVLLLVLASCKLGSAPAIREETFERVYEIDPRSTLKVQDVDGSIQIYGSNDNQLRIKAIKRSYSAERLRKIAVNIDVQPGNIAITTVYPPPPRSFLADRSGTVDYVIAVPQTCRLASVQLDAGEMLVEGMQGQGVRVSLKNGRLLIRNCFANLDIFLVNGNLDIGYEWWEDQAFSVEATLTNANARLFLPQNPSLHLWAASEDGWVTADFIDTNSKNEVGRKRNAIDLSVGQPPRPEIRIHTGSGNIGIAKSFP